MGRYLLRCIRLILLFVAMFVGVGLVTGVVGFLLSFVPWPYHGLQKTKDAQAKTATCQMQDFQKAIWAYTADNGMPPTTHQGLDALVSEPTTSPRPRKWKKYLADVNSVPEDPWGNDYVYRSTAPAGKTFTITCYGGDGKPGGTGYDRDLITRR